MEEIFFFQYHLRMNRDQCMGMLVHERKWMIQRFVEQKEKESEAMEKARNKKSKTK